MRAWIVIGSTGEYSDRSEWYVGVFLSKEAAEAQATKLNNWCAENKVSRAHEYQMDWSKRHSLKCPLDPKFGCDYTGTDYTVEETELPDSELTAKLREQDKWIEATLLEILQQKKAVARSQTPNELFVNVDNIIGNIFPDFMERLREQRSKEQERKCIK